MRCPRCGDMRDRVIDSRLIQDGERIRRRRQCLDCATRYTTYETIEQIELLKDQYYQFAGWDVSTGNPTSGKLAELGLEWVSTL